MIVTPLDAAELDSKEQYVFYHRLVDFSLKELLVNLQHEQLVNQQELILFKQYSDLFLYSIEAMRIKYMYDTETNMKVDLTNSGFPNYLEFRYLYNDLSLKENYLNKLTDVAIVKEEILDELLWNKNLLTKEKLFQAASIVYYTSVKKEFIFNRFVQGKIVTLSTVAKTHYLISWGFYDVSKNRPFICFMYFDCYERDMDVFKEKIYEVLQQVADREMDLDVMAYQIDKRLPTLMPKEIKRIDLGPLHSIFAKDDNPVTHLILEGISQKEIPLESYAFSLKIAQTVSKSTFKEGSFFKKQEFQNWQKPTQQKVLFCPHRIIQLIYSKYPEIIKTLSKPPIEMARLHPNKKKLN